MKAIKTIKLKISSTSKADGVLEKWLLAANWLSGVVFRSRELNSNRVAKEHYPRLRELGLPSQIALSCCKTVCAAYKAEKSNKCWRLAKFRHPALPVVWKRDFNRTRRGITLWGELITINDPRGLPEGKWKDSKIKRCGRQWYLCLAHEVDVAELKATGCLVGVDLGVKRMFVATNSDNSKTVFYRGGELNHRRSAIRRTRAAIQSVGSKSSRCLLKRMSGNEAAVTGHLLHVASKALVQYAVANKARCIVMENLSNIRDSSIDKGKRFRSKIHRWPYADFLFKVRYKAEALGIEVKLVSPRNTSRGCSRCGHVEKSNRRGFKFECKACGYQTDADRNASINIRQRSVSVGHNSAETGSHKSPESSESVCSSNSHSVTLGLKPTG